RRGSKCSPGAALMQPLLCDPPGEKIPVGISSCLLGEKVRYDGQHQLQPYIEQTLGEFFQFLPFCPEVAIGLGVPRQPIRLVRDRPGISGQSDQIRCVSLDGSTDYTATLENCADDHSVSLSGICGYILKK